MKINDYVLKFNKEFYYPIKQGTKESTIRKNTKPLNVGDYVVAFFPELKQGLLLQITEHYAKKLNELSHKEAECEGYYHSDLLIHSIKKIYLELKEDDYVYFYKFVVKMNKPNVEQKIVDFLESKELI